MIASSSEGMKDLLRKVKREKSLNMTKTKILTTDNCNRDAFELDGDEIEVVTDLNLLGSMAKISNEGSPRGSHQ